MTYFDWILLLWYCTLCSIKPQVVVQMGLNQLKNSVKERAWRVNWKVFLCIQVAMDRRQEHEVLKTQSEETQINCINFQLQNCHQHADNFVFKKKKTKTFKQYLVKFCILKLMLTQFLRLFLVVWDINFWIFSNAAHELPFQLISWWLHVFSFCGNIFHSNVCNRVIIDSTRRAYHTCSKDFLMISLQCSIKKYSVQFLNGNWVLYWENID